MQTSTNQINTRGGIHDSEICNLGMDGARCSVCTWANEIEIRRAVDEFELFKAMSDYFVSAGAEALAEKVNCFMTERGIY